MSRQSDQIQYFRYGTNQTVRRVLYLLIGEGRTIGFGES